MTIITLRDSGRLPVSPSPLPLFSTLYSLVFRLNEGWQRRKAERLLQGLPADIRKDIGWPTNDRMPSHR